MIESLYRPLLDLVADTDLAPWVDALASAHRPLTDSDNGHLPRWSHALSAMPDVAPSSVDLGTDAVTIGQRSDLTASEFDALEETLMAFHPWRKGPWRFFGMEIDTEWRSQLKWGRIRPAISNLSGRLVLDVGSGNGYYAYRMAAEGARLALGADPYLLYVMQSLLARKYLPDSCPAWVVPLGIEDLPPPIPVFDTVFSMGVLYHRRSPLDHLLELRELLRPGGELVLETLVVDGDAGYSLLPGGRYAKMRNTWFIPSLPTLEQWLTRCGFSELKQADVSATTVEEQRSTDWMTFDSLATFLDPDDPSRTIEGYPGPKRALYVATK